MGLLDGILGFFGSREQNATAKQIAADQNRVAIELASNQHQREVADLKAAGLNPILSAGGSGSAIPNLTTPQVANVMDKFGGADESAKQAFMLKENLKNLQADTDQKTESATLAKENQDVSRQQGQKLIADYWKTDAEKNLTRQLEVNAKKDNLKKDKEIQLIEAQTNSARNTSRISGIEADSAETMGEMYRNLEKGGSMAKGLVGGAKVLKDIFSSTPAATKFPRRPYVH